MSKVKVIPHLFGGMGNQLFIYAAARRLALVNDAELVLDDVSGFAYDTVYQRHYQLDHFNIPCRKATAAERLEPFSRLRRKVKRKLNLCLPFEQRHYLVQEGIDFDPRLLDVRLRDKLYLEGYWQSERYFSDVESQIRQDLDILPPKDAINLGYAGRIGQSLAVAVHVRFFDEPESLVSSNSNNASNGYYARAIHAMEALVSGAHYYIFSDKPEAARCRIPLPDERITLIHHNEGEENAYADLWLMTQCRHFIIANSTFSWWGGWLGKYEKKIVIAPGFVKPGGVGSWGFLGLLPDSWLKI